MIGWEDGIPISLNVLKLGLIALHAEIPTKTQEPNFKKLIDNCDEGKYTAISTVEPRHGEKGSLKTFDLLLNT